MKFSFRWLSVAIALFLAACVGFFALRPLLFGASVTPYVVTRGNIVQTIVASGRAETPSGVDVGSQIIGTVAKVLVDEGVRVKAGEPLVLLDDQQAKAVRDQAQATLDQAEIRRRQLAELTLPVAEQTMNQMRATLMNAKTQLERVERLATRSVATDATLEEARRAYEVAQSQVRSAELSVRSASPGGSDRLLVDAALAQATAALRIAEAQLRLTTVSSPIDGIVTKRDVEEGAVVQSGRALLHLAPDIPKQLVVQIDERNLSLVRLGQKALASADANPSVTFPAEIAFINSTIDADRGSVEIKLSMPQVPSFLKENMTVSIDIEVARREGGLLLPLEAIRNAASPNPTVLIALNGKAAERAVKLGARGSGKVEILDGVIEGDTVIPAALLAIKPGDRVRLQPPVQSQ